MSYFDPNFKKLIEAQMQEISLQYPHWPAEARIGFCQCHLLLVNANNQIVIIEELKKQNESVKKNEPFIILKDEQSGK